VKNVEARFPQFLDKYMSPGKSGNSRASTWTKLFLQRLSDIHLTSHLDEEVEENGDITRVYIFGAIALFILLIACINYMNLSTARSALRAREIGIRKVSGAQRGEIIAQFLSESVLITWMATILAIVLVYISLPSLNKITGQDLTIESLNRPIIWIPLLITPFIVGTISGLYPALFMSSFQPVKVLKGLFKAGDQTINFRKVLVVTQFSISIILIVCTAIVFQQLHYMQQKSLGFDKDHVLEMRYDGDLGKNFEAFRNELLQNSAIRDVSRSSRIPGGRLLDANGASTESGDSLRPVNADIKYVTADYDFAATYGLKIVAGRNFSRNYATDSNNFVLNEAATRALGLQTSTEAIGKNFKYGDQKGRVIGVIGDFNFESLHQQIVPLVLVMPNANLPGGYRRLSIKIAGKDIPAALAHVQSAWKHYLPETPCEYQFVDDSFQKLYENEQRQGTLFTTFSGIAIFLACLGLFGLSAFSITQRIKEIGIRKVLGASTGSIVTLLSKDFLKLVAIASLIAFPVAWYAMHNWLGDFAYRISIQWWVFILAGILAAGVALLTIGFQAIKAALSNPVKNLRTE
jgi:putative ABC transport system permease protein